MARAPAVERRDVRIGRPLAEVIEVNLVLAGLGLQPRPGPGVPGEAGVAEQVSRRAQGLLVGRRRIGGQDLVGIGAVSRLHRGDVVRRRHRRHEQRTFV